MKKRNQGFSLVELIVVVAIMGVLMTMMGIGIGVVVNQRVKSNATKVKELMQSTQQVAMSKNDCCVEFTRNSDGVQVIAYSEKKGATAKKFESESIGDKITVSYHLSTDSAGTYHEINESTTLTISWIRASGAFQYATVNGSSSGAYCTELKFTKGDKDVILQLATQTGRVTTK